jgi:RNA polymerase sigma-B factor
MLNPSLGLLASCYQKPVLLHDREHSMIFVRPSLELWLRERLVEHRDRVISEHRYLCVRAARKFVRPGLDRADLEQTAALGLIKAVDRYDASQETPFEGYAWLLVLGELMHHVRDGERLLRAPRRVRELDRRWVSAERELWSLLGREPRESDVACFINASNADRREVRDYRASGTLVSMEKLDAKRSREAEEEIDVVLRRMTIDAAMDRLAPIERDILRAVYFGGESLAEVAARLGYSRRHLTRLHRRALRSAAELLKQA